MTRSQIILVAARAIVLFAACIGTSCRDGRGHREADALAASKRVQAVHAAASGFEQEKAFAELVAYMKETHGSRQFAIRVQGWDANMRHTNLFVEAAAESIRYIEVRPGEEAKSSPFPGIMVELKSTNVVPMLRTNLYYGY